MDSSLKIDPLAFVNNLGKNEDISAADKKAIAMLQEEINYAQQHKLNVLIQPHIVAKALYHATGIETNLGEHSPIHGDDTKKLTKLFNNGHSKEDLLPNCGMLICAAGAVDPEKAATYIHDRIRVGSVEGSALEAALSDKVLRDGLSNLGKVHVSILDKARNGRF